MIFNNEVEAYKTWTLFLIFVSILVLIAGVVLLTHEKPENVKSAAGPGAGAPSTGKRMSRKRKAKRGGVNGSLEGEADGETLHEDEGEGEALWAVGEDSDEHEESDVDVEQDEDVDHHQNPLNCRFYRDEAAHGVGGLRSAGSGSGAGARGGEDVRLVEAIVNADDEDDRDGRRSTMMVERISSASSLKPSSGQSREWW